MAGTQAWSSLRAIDPTQVSLRWLPLLVLAEAGSALVSVLAQGMVLGVRSRWLGLWVLPPGRRPPPGPPDVVMSRGSAIDPAGDAPTLRTLLTTALAATALGYLVPGGPAVSAAYAARRFRRMGVPYAEAAQSQVATAACAGVALAAVTLTGLVIPGAAREAGIAAGPLVLARGATVLLLAVSLALLVVVRSDASRHGLGRSRLVRWVTGTRDPGTGDGQVAPLLGVRRLAACAALSVGVVLLDLAVLIGALHATHVPVPWRSLLLAYGLAQLVSLLPLTPGGAGLVEFGLGALLVAKSAPDGAVALAVLLYRAVSWGAVVSAGAVALAVQRRTPPPR